MSAWVMLCDQTSHSESNLVDAYGPFKSEKKALRYIDKHVNKSKDRAYTGGVRTPEEDFCEGGAERQSHDVAELYKP